VNQNFIRFVNQHIQKLAKDLALETDISTYYARHTFTTSMAFKWNTIFRLKLLPVFVPGNFLYQFNSNHFK